MPSRSKRSKVIEFPCSVCRKNVNNNHPAMVCSHCGLWSHNKCNNIDKTHYRLHQLNEELTFHCVKCVEDILPFMSLNDIEYTNFMVNGGTPSANNVTFTNFDPTNTQKQLFDKLNQEINDYNTRAMDDDNEPDFDQLLPCNYYDVKEFTDCKFDKNSFSIMHLNIHSIQLHIDDLRTLLNLLDYSFDIIAISESKLKSDPVVNISLAGYKSPLHTFTESEKGGTMLYIKDGINYKPRKDLEIYESKVLESTFIEIINAGDSNNLIGVIYRHPHMNTDAFINDKLNGLMHKLSLEKNKKVYLAGDFNFDLLKLTNHADTSHFYEKITSNLFTALITLPTKINSKSNTLIDNIFTNDLNPDAVSGNLTVCISDHLPSFTIIPKLRTHLPKTHNIQIRDMKNFDRESFMNDISNVDWNSSIDENNVNSSFDHILDKANEIMDKHVPLRKLTNKEFKRRYKPWITNGILKSIARKNKLYNKYTRTKNVLIKHNVFIEYKILRNRLNELIRISKKTHYQRFFTEHNNNLKKVWQGIKEIVNIKNKNMSTPTCIEVNGNIISDPKLVCNNFNDYFVNIADNILNKRKYGGNKQFTEYMKNPVNSSFVFNPCDPEEVELLINLLSVSKASGPNGIPTNILQMISKEISPALSKVFNIAVQTGTHPERLKLVNVIPIFKKGSRLLVSNYRPISLLSNLNKIFEKLMYRRMYDFIEKNNVLYSLQYGFRAKHSTTHALISITEKIRSALDGNKVSCGIFVDLQKAFDTVNHEILLKKLYHYGFRGIVNDWFRSYLNDRKQKVGLNGFESDIKTLRHGVPQGSVLGPILFLLYINDLHNCIQHCHTYHFADDTNLLNISDNYKTLQKQVNTDLANLSNWLLANKISLNKDKTELIYFHKVRSPLPSDSDIKIKLNGSTLSHTGKIKYLGVYLDETLSGSYHCEELTKKLCRANGILSKARHYVPPEILRNIYFATFSSNLLYGSQIWGQSQKTITDSIHRLQKKAVRIMSFSEFREHSEPLFKRLEILKVQDAIFLQNCTFVYDFFHDNLPKSFVDIFCKLAYNQNNNTRNTNLGMLFIPQYNSVTYGHKCIYKLCIDSWNSITYILRDLKDDNDLPIDLHSISRGQLKEKITKYLLDEYSE